MEKQTLPRRFGRYILLERITSGGMAEVYRARISGRDNFRRLVAIKCMLPSLAADGSFATMFIDEARLAAQLNHGNIVQIYELGRHEKQLYIAMELVQGHDLRATTKRARRMGKRLGVGFIAYIVSKAAEGLEYAHNKLSLDGTPLNLVHRDVSPQNILVSYDGEVKVADFGIAKAEQRATETRVGTLKGKFAYMSPEQVVGGPTDRRADIFALGSVLYEGATGRPLFRGDSDLATLEQVRTAKLPDLESHLSHAPNQLAQVIRKACALSPDDRYQSALDLADDLSPVLVSRGNLFGPKNARTTMRVLYSEEWTTLPQRMKNFAAIELDDDDKQTPSTHVLGALLHSSEGNTRTLGPRINSHRMHRRGNPFVEDSTSQHTSTELFSSHQTPHSSDGHTDFDTGGVAEITGKPAPVEDVFDRDQFALSGTTRLFTDFRDLPLKVQYAFVGVLGVCLLIILTLSIVLVSRGNSAASTQNEVVVIEE